jgi:hypothetical protein
MSSIAGRKKNDYAVMAEVARKRIGYAMVAIDALDCPEVL